MGTPHFAPEPDWTITLSQAEFPWRQVKVSDFSPLQCYKKFTELITDEFLFNKHVRGESELTYKKLIKAHSRQMGKKRQRISLSKISNVKAEAESLIRMKQAEVEERKR